MRIDPSSPSCRSGIRPDLMLPIAQGPSTHFRSSSGLDILDKALEHIGKLALGMKTVLDR